MSIKIEPFKNNIGASITCDLKSLKTDEIEKTKEALNNYGFVCFRNQNLESKIIPFFSAYSQSLSLSMS